LWLSLENAMNVDSNKYSGKTTLQFWRIHISAAVGIEIASKCCVLSVTKHMHVSKRLVAGSPLARQIAARNATVGIIPYQT
jgi:hypothetical protein